MEPAMNQVPDDEEPWIALSDPDMSGAELVAVGEVLRSSRISSGPVVERFEDEFSTWLGRTYGIAVSSGTAGLMLVLRALGIGPGDEVIAPAYSWHQISHAIALVGATPVFADIDYWSGTVPADKVAPRITPRTRAIIACNNNGHPAAWAELRRLANSHGLRLIEDSTEAIGSRYQGRMVGTFGDVAIFDFSQPMALTCGEGGMIVTDDPQLASELHYLRGHTVQDRISISVGSRLPQQAGLSDMAAALGLAQLVRIDEILARRKKVETYYLTHIQTFEGIKPPYIGPEVDEVHWMTYIVHLGTRFTRSARNQILDDLHTDKIEAAAYCLPLHQQFYYTRYGYKTGALLVTEKIADRALALPFHAHLEEDEIQFIVQTAKASSVNIGAGVPIY